MCYTEVPMSSHTRLLNPRGIGHTMPDRPPDSQPAGRVWLLGGLRVSANQGAVQIAGGKLRSLFALLALQPAASLTRERLADTLWPDAPPERARHNLANALYS